MKVLDITSYLTVRIYLYIYISDYTQNRLYRSKVRWQDSHQRDGCHDAMHLCIWIKRTLNKTIQVPRMIIVLFFINIIIRAGGFWYKGYIRHYIDYKSSDKSLWIMAMHVSTLRYVTLRYVTLVYITTQHPSLVFESTSTSCLLWCSSRPQHPGLVYCVSLKLSLLCTHTLLRSINWTWCYETVPTVVIDDRVVLVWDGER